jgi:hypothetical protein
VLLSVEIVPEPTRGAAAPAADCERPGAQCTVGATPKVGGIAAPDAAPRPGWVRPAAAR